MLYVIGPKPLFLHFQRYLKAQWPEISPLKILYHADGYFVLKLSEQDMKIILEGGPYTMNKKTVIVKKKGD